MSTVNELLSRFSLEEVFIFTMLIFTAVKVMGELFDYFYKKLKNYFGQKDEAEERLQNIESRLNALEESTNVHFLELKDAQTKRDLQVSNIQEQTEDIIAKMRGSEKLCILERIQVYEQEGYITDIALQNLLQRYEIYAPWNDTYLDRRIEDARKLPIK